MSRRLGVLVALGTVATCALACEGIAHVSSFAIRAQAIEGGADAPYVGPCNECPPQAGDVRRPPCPSSSDAPDDGKVRTYVWRRIHLGASRDEWLAPKDATYSVGMDQDCSTRPNG